MSSIPKDLNSSSFTGNYPSHNPPSLALRFPSARRPERGAPQKGHFSVPIILRSFILTWTLVLQTRQGIVTCSMSRARMRIFVLLKGLIAGYLLCFDPYIYRRKGSYTHANKTIPARICDRVFSLQGNLVTGRGFLSMIFGINIYIPAKKEFCELRI
jgi:hypothetical protein